MHPLYFYLALIGFLCYCQAAPLDDPKEVDEPPFIKVDASNATLYIGGGPLNCNKYAFVPQKDKNDAINAMNEHYNRGQWGIKCYPNGWCVDARNLLSWDSPKDCMNELRGKLQECLDHNAWDGYTEQNYSGAVCMMHYWLDGI